MISVYNASTQKQTIEGIDFPAKSVVQVTEFPKAGGPLIEAGILQIRSNDATTRQYDWANAQVIAAGATSAASTAINYNEVMLCATEACCFTVGDAPTATLLAGSAPLSAGEKFHLQIVPGQKVAAIRFGASSGSLYIVPCL